MITPENKPRGSAVAVLSETAEIVQHTLAFIMAIVSIWCVHLVFERLLGKEATFYDIVPMRYVFDTGHLAVLVRFIWKIVTGIWGQK
jgi:hypothetical protein